MVLSATIRLLGSSSLIKEKQLESIPSIVIVVACVILYGLLLGLVWFVARPRPHKYHTVPFLSLAEHPNMYWRRRVLLEGVTWRFYPDWIYEVTLPDVFAGVSLISCPAEKEVIIPGTLKDEAEDISILCLLAGTPEEMGIFLKQFRKTTLTCVSVSGKFLKTGLVIENYLINAQAST